MRISKMINGAKVKKWLKMFAGKSMHHVSQGVGKNYSFTSVKGYYNDLTNKVLLDKEHINDIEPFSIEFEGNDIIFSIAIFQYGLASYDLFLETGDELYLHKFIAHANWAVSNQNNDGSWETFGFMYPQHPYSSMAQGEGISLLVRAYCFTNNTMYLNAALNAYEFMVKPVESGGTAKYEKNKIYFLEYTHLPYVFNGWIFSIFGVMDLFILTGEVKYKHILDKTLDTFINCLPKMDNGYWSMYRNDKTIASPFYHSLHISLLAVLYHYTLIPVLNEYRERFIKYQSKSWNRKRALIKKSFQKIFE